MCPLLHVLAISVGTHAVHIVHFSWKAAPLAEEFEWHRHALCQNVFSAFRKKLSPTLGPGFGAWMCPYSVYLADCHACICVC